jgi:hypothetical protein
MHEQDDGGTKADHLLDAIANAKLGYAFIGLIGNEEPPRPPRNAASAEKHSSGLIFLNVTENQMAAVCTKGEKHCSNPCEPAPPAKSGPWFPTNPPINNLHRAYIQGVPGEFVQHPVTDPQREQILEYMKQGGANNTLRGMEVYNSWVEQAWDAAVPLKDSDIDNIYPTFSKAYAMHYWDETLRSLKRPVWGLADDDGFVYTGDSSEPVYPHEKKDTVQTDTQAW